MKIPHASMNHPERISEERLARLAKNLMMGCALLSGSAGTGRSGRGNKTIVVPIATMQAGQAMPLRTNALKASMVG